MAYRPQLGFVGAACCPRREPSSGVGISILSRRAFLFHSKPNLKPLPVLPLQAVLPRLKIYAAKARLRELKAEMLEARLREQEEKLDVAAAMGWHDEAEEEADEAARWVALLNGVCCRDHETFPPSPCPGPLHPLSAPPCIGAAGQEQEETDEVARLVGACRLPCAPPPLLSLLLHCEP
jgi:hypothetical protein